jgi:putative endonuclease
LYSSSTDKYYTGQTDNLEDRLFRHTNSGSKSTKFTDDWKLIYTETYSTRRGVIQREQEIKKRKTANILGCWFAQLNRTPPARLRKCYRFETGICLPGYTWSFFACTL